MYQAGSQDSKQPFGRVIPEGLRRRACRLGLTAYTFHCQSAPLFFRKILFGGASNRNCLGG